MGKHLFIYDKNGKIILHTYSSDDLNIIPEDVQVLYSNNDIDLSKYRVIGINTDTKEPILENIVEELTEEEILKRQNADLAYQLMLKEGVR